LRDKEKGEGDEKQLATKVLASQEDQAQEPNRRD
jgi:hypothetical protein